MKKIIRVLTVTAAREYDAETYGFMTEKTNLIIYNPKTDKVVLLVPLQNVLLCELTEAEVGNDEQ